jgi:hypothetical protein
MSYFDTIQDRCLLVCWLIILLIATDIAVDGPFGGNEGLQSLSLVFIIAMAALLPIERKPK